MTVSFHIYFAVKNKIILVRCPFFPYIIHTPFK